MAFILTGGRTAVAINPISGHRRHEGLPEGVHNQGEVHGAGTQLRLDVINLLDRTCEIRDGTGVGVGAPQYGLRRTILGGLLQRF